MKVFESCFDPNGTSSIIRFRSRRVWIILIVLLMVYITFMQLSVGMFLRTNITYYVNAFASKELTARFSDRVDTPPNEDNTTTTNHVPMVEGSFTNHSLVGSNSTNHGIVSEKPQPRLVVLYTPQFGNRRWWDFPDDCSRFAATYQCSAADCTISNDPSRHREAHALLFHARDMVSVDELKRLRESSTVPNLKLVYYSWECPINAPDVRPLSPFFDWTVTYKMSSTFPAPYESFRPRTESDGPPPVHGDVHSTKTKEIAWIVSHCGLFREDFARKMMKSIPLDVFGGCSGRFGQNNRIDQNSYEQLIKQYKFYLSFENSFCIDYITEKYWNPVGFSIPIVMGAGNYSSLIPGSYINVHDFSTWSSFIQYIKNVSSDRLLYNSYFNWNQKYVARAFRPDSHWSCNLCKALVSRDPPLPSSLSDSFLRANDCPGVPKNVQDLLSKDD